MKAQQCVELTRTNRPFGLTIKLTSFVVPFFRTRLRPVLRLYRLLLFEFAARHILLSKLKFDSRNPNFAFAVFSYGVLTVDDFFSVFVSRVSLFQFPGGHAAGVTPVPIPNTEVKPRWADDTALATVWERRSLPGLFLQTPRFRITGSGRFSFHRLQFLPLLLPGAALFSRRKEFPLRISPVSSCSVL